MEQFIDRTFQWRHGDDGVYIWCGQNSFAMETKRLIYIIDIYIICSSCITFIEQIIL